MYLDTSSMIAILVSEPEGDEMIERLGSYERRVTSIVTMFETILSLGKITGDRENAPRQVRQFIRAAGIEVVAVDATASDAFIEAYQTYHRGAEHPAKLSFGDCISYAIAKTLGLRLLYKGDDFARTDLA
ncbi:type II toxin-antitoxin system VapC family toxin [Mesorhizobium microcysteis]|uniref:Ribonuclease VapC n=1 Tax=Neoaquamicrobium microcysteis TaxID=2682781 RepID=A0A5D4GYD1_9HYPH|nr:type II toxin-antitoxin system VapC family toxin [Mesorhizobium microcysteis]TYR32879.1 type II toxin-antitoxin system VapC family toxin [Mesorhizobium microcysteis]